jgi:hypothetical protein
LTIADCRLTTAVARPALLSKSAIGNRKSKMNYGGTERTRTVIGLVDNQVPHLSATVPCDIWQRVSDSNRRSPD